MSSTGEPKLDTFSGSPRQFYAELMDGRDMLKCIDDAFDHEDGTACAYMDVRTPSCFPDWFCMPATLRMRESDYFFGGGAVCLWYDTIRILYCGPHLVIMYGILLCAFVSVLLLDRKTLWRRKAVRGGSTDQAPQKE